MRPSNVSNSRPLRLLPFFASVALVLAACQGGGSSAPATTTSPNASASPAGSGAALTIEIKATDALQFEPPALTVKAGSPIRFVVTNTGSTDHEFYIGDQAAQEAHGIEMGGMQMGSMMPDETDGMSVPAGQTKTLDYTFTEAGATLIGCHVPGHYEAGMKINVTVEP